MKSIVLFVLIVTYISCGKNPGSRKRPATIQQSQISEVLEKQRFDCASLGGPCPAGMARLFIIDPTHSQASGVCSGFMINSRQLVTNHHCVSTVKECHNTYMAIYNGTNYEQARCKSIIRSDQDVDDPNDPTRKIDYTIMEIDQPFKGNVFSLSLSNAKVGDRVKTWVIDHTGLDMIPANLFDSRVTEFECVVSPSERASLFMVSCPIISGNSGSPVLNEDDQVVGVIWGGSSSTVDSSYDLDLRRSLDAVALATEVNFFRP